MEAAPAAPKKEAKKAEPKAKKVEDATAKVEVSSDLNSMTVAQLKALAKEKGIEGYTTLKKAELIDVLSK